MDTSIVDATAALAQNEHRKRRHSSRMDGQEAAKKKKAEDRLAVDIGILAKKYGVSKQTVRAALRAEQQEKLPSINDAAAIEAFFQTTRRASPKELVPVVDHRQPTASATNTTTPPKSSKKIRTGHIPDDHPMRPFVDMSDKEISVKEALARGFRNYRVRLPKQKNGENDDELGDVHQPGSTANLATLLAETLSNPHSKARQMRRSDAEEKRLNEIMESAIGTGKRIGGGRLKKIGNGHKRLENLSLALEDAADYMGSRMSPDDLDDFDDVPDNDTTSSMLEYSLALPPFWQLPLVVSKGYKGGFYVMGVKFVQMTTLVHHNAIMVSINEPIRLILDEKELSLTLFQLLAVNGVVVRNPAKVDDLNEVFNTCCFLVHHAIAEYLLNTSTLLALKTNSKINRDYAPIKISAEIPPFCCYRQQFFNTALGTKQGENEILDGSIFEHLAKTLPGGPCGIANLQFESTSSDRKLSAKEQLHVVTHFDAGTEVEDIAEKFGITADEVELIVADRERVQSSAALVLMEEAREEVRSAQIRLDSPPPCDSSSKNSKEMAKRKNKVRRTNFAGLNIMMWRFFKDCSENGVPLNGKMLKEQAMLLAKQLGLENFKGSEGWLDAFKRRHKIDLKQMSGSPANYEEDAATASGEDSKMDMDETAAADGAGSEGGADAANSALELDEAILNGDFSLSHLSASNDGINAALLECVEKAAHPHSASASPVTDAAAASISISRMQPLDLTHLFSNNHISGGHLNGLLMEPSTSNGHLNLSSEEFMMMNRREQSMSPSQQMNESCLIASVVKSAAIRVPDKEVSFALDTIRSFLLTNDPTAMPLLLDLQLRLAAMRSSSTASTVGGPSPAPSSPSPADDVSS